MITKYDPKIYPLKLYVAVGDDQWGEIYRKFTKLNHDPIDTSKDEIKGCKGMTIFVREKSTNHLGVLIWLSNDGIGVSTVAHESAHYVCNVFDYCDIAMGYKNGQDEHFAYFIGWCVECVMDSVTKYLKKSIKGQIDTDK
mgnify:FL=1|jgi:hypothetical protein|nr:MAG TPA: hypothetical protein [Caudoviricetes sp.]